MHHSMVLVANDNIADYWDKKYDNSMYRLIQKRIVINLIQANLTKMVSK
jgi:hypothetical protein